MNANKKVLTVDSETKVSYTDVNAYIATFTPEIQAILCKLREVIQNAAPEAEEKISYQMPTFYLYGNLVHFAAMKKHIGFYPSPSGIEAFKAQLLDYKCSKGAIQFPLEKPIPYDLIAAIVKFRVAENTNKKK